MTARSQFDEELSAYYRDIMYMGTMVEQFLLEVVDAFVAGDAEASRKLLEKDLLIDGMQTELEKKSVLLLLLQSPVAKDLRKIITSIKIVADLERIGDYTVHLAKLGFKTNPGLYARFIPRIAEMARTGASMIRDSLTAYIGDDAELAKATAARDDRMDALKKEIVAEPATLKPSDEKEMRQIFRYFSICKDLERLGDHTTTICEWVVFSVNGEKVILND